MLKPNKLRRSVFAILLFAVSGVPIAAGPIHGHDMHRIEIQGAATAPLDDADPVGRIELQGKDDPTFERVARYYPPMKHPRELVGVPDHPFSIGIDPVGRIQFNTDAGADNSPQVWFELSDSPGALVPDSNALNHLLLDGFLPIVLLSGRRNGMEFEQTAFGWSEGFKPEAELYACLRLRVRVPPGMPLPEHLTLARKPHGARTELKLSILSGRLGEVCVRIPFRNPDRAELITSKAFAATLSQTRHFWRTLLGQGIQLELPEPRVNNAWKAWLAYSLLNVHRSNGYDEPHDGTGFYDLVYGYSATLYCIALDLYGLHQQAERCLDCLIHFQQPDGLYTQNYGLPDQGAFLLALAEHYRLTGDRVWLQRVADPMVRAADWILRRRESAPRAGLTKGLIKFRPYCDYAEPTYNYYSDAYCCMGLEAAANVLPAIGRKQDAARFLDEVSRYRSDIFASMLFSAFHRDGHVIVPIEPDTHRLEKASGYRGGEYYGLLASCLLETEFLTFNDQNGLWITDFMERAGGLTAGLCRFDTGIDHAYSYGYLLMQLKRKAARRFLLGFYGMLAYGMTRDTYSGVEVTKLMSGENYHTLPHLYSCTQQLRTLRMMLLWEDRSHLRLGEAIPRAWLADGKQVVVRNAPTRFGAISYTIRSHAATGRIDVRFVPPPRTMSGEISLRLRHPRGRLIKHVIVNGRPWRNFSDELILLDGIRKPVLIQATY